MRTLHTASALVLLTACASVDGPRDAAGPDASTAPTSGWTTPGTTDPTAGTDTTGTTSTTGGTGGTTTTTDPTGTTGGTTTTTPPEPVDPMSLMPCALERECATQGPYLGDTCCAEGDSLVPSGETLGDVSEILDVETDGQRVFWCSVFGMGTTSLDPAELDDFTLDPDEGRCTAVAIGPQTPTGGQIYYHTFWGDSYGDPVLGTHEVGRGLVSVEGDGALRYGGLDYRDGRLWAALYDDGVRRYAVSPSGALTKAGDLPLFENAVDVVLGGEHAYVGDGPSVVVLADLDDPYVVATIPVDRVVQDLVLSDDTLYVALGASGVRAYDLTDPANPVERGHIPSDGSAVRVDAHGDRLAVAQWNHVALYDGPTLAQVGTAKVRSDTEQDFGVAVWDDQLFVGEWRGAFALDHHPGLVAPDLWVPDTTMMFGLDPGEALLAVHNRGPLPLDLTATAVDAGPITIDPPAVTLAPGESLDLVVTYAGGPLLDAATIVVDSNDPDPAAEVVLRSRDRHLLIEGDPITPAFGFLDPTGEGDIENLRGEVTFVAYFALF